jgi:hypothetical protein
MRIVYAVFGIIMLGVAFLFWEMTQVPWAADRAYGYVGVGLCGLVGLMAEYSAIFIKEKKED